MGLSSISTSMASVQPLHSLPSLAEKEANTGRQSSRGYDPNARPAPSGEEGAADSPSKRTSSRASQGRSSSSAQTSSPSPSSSSSSSQMDAEALQALSQLKARDAEVRAHEMAHMAAGGSYVQGGPHYETVTGPDGRSYAVGGEVSLDVSSIPGDPQATAAKMQTIKRAALAPAQPSPQDYRVASAAQNKANKAYQELIALAAEMSAQGTHRRAPSSGSSVDTVV